jgi:hypothetical protein
VSTPRRLTLCSFELLLWAGGEPFPAVMFLVWVNPTKRRVPHPSRGVRRVRVKYVRSYKSGPCWNFRAILCAVILVRETLFHHHYWIPVT